MENKKPKNKEIISNIVIILIVATIWILLITQIGINVIKH